MSDEATPSVGTMGSDTWGVWSRRRLESFPYIAAWLEIVLVLLVAFVVGGVLLWPAFTAPGQPPG